MGLPMPLCMSQSQSQGYSKEHCSLATCAALETQDMEFWPWHTLLRATFSWPQVVWINLEQGRIIIPELPSKRPQTSILANP
jgi:hypothetical protein